MQSYLHTYRQQSGYWGSLINQNSNKRVTTNLIHLQSKVSSILLYGGSSFGETSLLKTIDVDPLTCCWISAPVSDDECSHYRMELRGPEATLRVRQIKLLGYTAEDKAAQFKQHLKSTSANYIQQKNCETETLRVFRLLTGQVSLDTTRMLGWKGMVLADKT